MDSSLIYYKTKDKTYIQRCIIEINDEKKLESLFKILNQNDSRIKKVIKFSTIAKTSEYADKSWEIQTKSGNKYRFRAENQDENEKWYKLVKDILDPNLNEINIDSNSNHDVIVQMQPEYSRKSDDKNIYDVKLVEEQTNPNFLKLFAKDAIYVVSIEEDAVYLINKHNQNEIHKFDASIIRKYGSFKNCFAFELGRNLEYGPGLIVVRPIKYESKYVCDFLYESVNKKFTQLSVKNSKINNVTYDTQENYEYNQLSREMSDLVPNPAPPPIKTRNKEFRNQQMNQRANRQLEQTIPIQYSNVVVQNDQFNRYKGQVQTTSSRKTYVKQRSIESNETDSSFYMDKYVPEYMSNRHLTSPALEYFVDEQNSVYGRVKL